MSYRILHCGKSLTNYRLCIEHSVAGFNTRGPEKDDIIFLVVNYQKQTLCGLRAKLGEPTDQQPWPDSERYVSVYNLVEIEYAAPFDIRFLADYGGQYWSLKFLQQAKAIKDEKAIQALNDTFNKYHCEEAVLLVETNSSSKEEEQDDTSWIKQLRPELSDQLVGREIDRVLTEAFQQALQVLLIIDDLSDEQKDTITNVIRAFKLESGESIEFIAYIVRLEQRIRISDSSAEYALSVQ